MKTKKKTVSTIIVLVVVILLLFGAVGTIVILARKAKTTDSIASETETISSSVSLNGKKIATGTQLSLNDVLTFDIDGKEYTVKIVPNEKAPDYDFIVDEKFVSLKSVEDVTSCFDIEKTEKGFTLNASKTIEDFARILFPGKTVSISEDRDFSKNAYFVLNVIVDGTEYAFPIVANVSRNVTSITLDVEEIVF